MKTIHKLLLINLLLFSLSTTIFAQNTEKISEEQPEYNQEPKSLFIKPETRQDDIKTIIGPVHSNGLYIGVESMFIDYKEWLSSGINVKLDWVLNHVFSFGIQGGFLESPLQYNAYLNEKTSIESGFGGINFEFTPAPKWPVHLSFPINIGFGSMYLLGQDESLYSRFEEDYYYNTTLASDFFAYIQPAAQIEFNLLKHLRLGFGISYFQTNTIEIDGLSKYALNGPSGLFSLKIGKF